MTFIFDHRRKTCYLEKTKVDLSDHFCPLRAIIASGVPYIYTGFYETGVQICNTSIDAWTRDLFARHPSRSIIMFAQYRSTAIKLFYEKRNRLLKVNTNAELPYKNCSRKKQLEEEKKMNHRCKFADPFYNASKYRQETRRINGIRYRRICKKSKYYF